MHFSEEAELSLDLLAFFASTPAEAKGG